MSKMCLKGVQKGLHQDGKAPTHKSHKSHKGIMLDGCPKCAGLRPVFNFLECLQRMFIKKIRILFLCAVDI